MFVEALLVIDFRCQRSLRWRHATCGDVSGLCVGGATSSKHYQRPQIQWRHSLTMVTCFLKSHVTAAVSVV